jgi:hypothetical protein
VESGRGSDNGGEDGGRHLHVAHSKTATCEGHWGVGMEIISELKADKGGGDGSTHAQESELRFPDLPVCVLWMTTAWR